MIDLRTPEGTLAELRKQASELQIPGRSKMNKGDLIAAILAERTVRETEAEATQTLDEPTDTRPPVKVPDYTAVAAIQPVTFHADQPSTPEPVSPLTLAARLARTRTGRRDYPASSKHKRTRRNARKGGRK